MSTRAVTTAPTLPRDAGPDTIWATLRRSGTVLLEDAVTTPREFERVTEAFAESFRVHQSLTRQRYNEDDTTQGVSEGTDALALHAERAYLPARPELLFFGCLAPPTAGGATVWCDGAALLDFLSPDDTEQLEATTLRWRTPMERGRWQRLLHTDDTAEAAARLDQLLQRYGEEAHTTHWFDNEILHIEYRTPALTLGWISQRKAFANTLLLAAVELDGPGATQADGRPVPADLLHRVAAAADALTRDVVWQRGDLLIIDNMRCMHGRRAFVGTERQILVRMGDARPPFRRQAS